MWPKNKPTKILFLPCLTRRKCRSPFFLGGLLLLSPSSPPLSIQNPLGLWEGDAPTQVPRPRKPALICKGKVNEDILISFKELTSKRWAEGKGHWSPRREVLTDVPQKEEGLKTYRGRVGHSHCLGAAHIVHCPFILCSACVESALLGSGLEEVRLPLRNILVLATRFPPLKNPHSISYGSLSEENR